MTAPVRLLIDTDVCIDYLRGREEAVSWLEGTNASLLMSAVTVAELFAGVREGEERETLETFIEAYDVIPVDERVAVRAGLYRRDYLKSHGTGLGDAVIAATAEVEKATLATLNERHFPMLRRVLIPYRKA